MARVPIIRQDDGELLGYIDNGVAGWSAQTIFGYVFARSDNRAAAEEAVRTQGLAVLQGLWQYYDKKDRAWHPCVLKEVYESRVVVIRTNDLGYQDPDSYKVVSIMNPAETNLVKA